MQMKLKVFTTILGSPALILLLRPQADHVVVSAECLVGDVMLMKGDDAGYIGLECLNGTAFDSVHSFCGAGGILEEMDMVHTCPEESPYCVQCSERGLGAALCLNTEEVPSDCAMDATVGGEEDDASTTGEMSGGCLVGDVMYMEGDDAGYIGLECLNGTAFDSVHSFCGAGGIIEEMDMVHTCPEESPYCVQCGERGLGAALCLNTEEVPSDCAMDATDGDEEDDASMAGEMSGGCLVGDIMFQVGDNAGHIGLECINATSYKARESICGADGNLEDNMDAQYTCPEESSYCVQCGVAGELGAALCLTSPDVPSDCSSSIVTTATTTSETASAPDAEPAPASTSASSPSTSGSTVLTVASTWILMLLIGSLFFNVLSLWS